MKLIQFLNNNFAPIIAVFGTIVGTIIGAMSNWLLKKSEWNDQKKLRKLERSLDFEKQNLIEPIIKFIEAELLLIQQIYAIGFEKEPKAYDAYKAAWIDHLKNMLLTSAKIKVYDDKELSDKFEKFTQKRLSIGNKIFDKDSKDIDQAFNEMKQAENIVTEILKTLKNRLSNIEA